MSAVSIIMAGALRRDLLARGVQHIDLGDCEAIIARLFDCVRVIEHGAADDDAPPKRCATNEVDLDGSCMACGAAQGEACRAPRKGADQ
ncbi:hypothetical protein [Bradyrhizobium sp. SEMIA]|uniref:hypothetical protein n=1 Tax=Bradyrhizobium sp. SEMIA TaxID=2597515 RepID=UPI0018A5A858|nr:hypothetical protein [Bradyrhizobium sp. SEMIA]QOG20405.1 hypothetical protein FOM02_26710 [Bradyrhizobium sp. SEMIA]